MSKVVSELQNLGNIFTPLSEVIAKLPDMLMDKNLKLMAAGDSEAENPEEEEMIATLMSLCNSMGELRDQLLTSLLLEKQSPEDTQKVVSGLLNLGKLFHPMSEIIKKLPGVFAAKNVKLIASGETNAESPEERETISMVVSLNHSMSALHDQMLSSLAAERLLPLKHRETPPSEGTVDPQPTTTTVVATTTISNTPAANAGASNDPNSTPPPGREVESSEVNNQAIKGTTSTEPGLTGEDEATSVTVN